MTEPGFVEVALNIPHITGLFHYHLPEELLGKVKPGSLVVVPLSNREVQAVVLRLIKTSDVKETRAVSVLLDADPVVTEAQIELARQMAADTLIPIASCLTIMLPPGLGQQADTLYHLNMTAEQIVEARLSPMQARMVKLLTERGDLRGRQFETALGHPSWKAAARSLQKHGWIVTRAVLQAPSVHPKTVKTVQLGCAPEEAEARLESLGRAGSDALKRRQAMIRFLIHEGLPVETAWVYAQSGGNAADLHKLADEGLVILGESETWRDPLAHVAVEMAVPPELTSAQRAAWQTIQAGIEEAAKGESIPAPYLLHGITGSGKTEIYLRAVAETIRMGRQAQVLVPEISLTPQTVQRFLARFPGQVGLIHSRLSEGERYDTWRRARAGLLRVIVGPRSALFAPLPNLGLIVIDECHDGAYYQDDAPPNYHAVETAIQYAKITRSVLLMGSATPEVSLYYRALHEKWHILQLPVRILAHRAAVEAQRAQLGMAALPEEVLATDGTGNEESVAINLPPVTMVDMRQELKNGNRTIFSKALQSALKETLEAHQQAILFLNRRGTATYVFCRQCGYSLRCPHCDLPLTYHQDQNCLICHTCNYRRQMPKTCPECNSVQIRQFGTGTEKVESEVRAMFPEARTLRWDFETTRQKGAHEVLLQTFSDHRADILIGTQMLAKGLDLPLVTLVGVILAETGLQLPDYNAGERTFQLLTQVAGRAGRSLLGGKVILQTFLPDNYAIRAASQHDYAGFYRQEIAHRRKMGYPPFSRLIRLETRHTDAVRAEANARGVAQLLQRWIKEENYHSTNLIGPAPCFFGRQNNYFRWHIILRGPNPLEMLRQHALQELTSLGEWRVEVGPTSLL